MLDPIVLFITRIFERIGRGIGWLIAWLLWPFLAASKWYTRRGWIVRGVVGLLLIGLIAAYARFFWVTQHWADFDPDYPAKITMASGPSLAGDVNPGADAGAAVAQSPAPSENPNVNTADSSQLSGQKAQNAPAPAGQKCTPSSIVEVSAFLVDFNVNKNDWVSSMLLYKLGFFGIDWKNTPFFDNKAAFQLGINQVLRRTTTELVDVLGRVRGTSQIDQNLQNARTSLAYPEDAWYISFNGVVRPTPSVYRDAIRELRAFNNNLERCQTTFDARSDNLLQFLDRIAGDIGSTSDILRSRIEASNAGWFDPRADDRFWFAYGQLYAYYGILTATKADFSAIVNERQIVTIWGRMENQLRLSLNMQPWIVSNGNESSSLFPSHLANMGFYLLRVRSNLVEVRGILDR
jgi:hypothetical protein